MFGVTVGVILIFALIDIAYVHSKKELSYDNDIYQQPALLALEYYPELKDRKLIFRSRGKATTWAHKAVPRVSTLLLPERYRVYQVLIAEDQNGPLIATLFKNLNPNSKVGVLGHELAHVLDYSSMSSVEILNLGIQYYISDEYRLDYERATNCIAMNRGLRPHIMSWSEEVYNYLEQDNRGRYYHSPQEINEGVGCDE